MASKFVDNTTTISQALSTLNTSQVGVKQGHQSKIPKPLSLARKGNNQQQSYSPKSLKRWNQPCFPVPVKKRCQPTEKMVSGNKFCDEKLGLNVAPRINDKTLKATRIPKLLKTTGNIVNPSLSVVPRVPRSERRKSRIPIKLHAKKSFLEVTPEFDCLGQHPRSIEEQITQLETKELELLSVLFKIRQKLDQLKEQKDICNVLVPQKEHVSTSESMETLDGEPPLLSSPSAVYLRPLRKRCAT